MAPLGEAAASSMASSQNARISLFVMPATLRDPAADAEDPAAKTYHTGCPFCKCPSTAVSLFTDRRPLMGRGPVRKSPWGPRAWHWRVLPLRFCHVEEIGNFHPLARDEALG
jgi:hypothetical protein